MHEAVQRMIPDAEFYTPERCYINELSNWDTDPEVSIARARVPFGVTTRWHRVHGTTERYVVLSGCGRVEVGSLAPRMSARVMWCSFHPVAVNASPV